MARRPTQLGFSLVELLVVIGIIGVLMGILIPVISRVRRNAATTECMNNLRQIGALYIMYANQNDDWVPVGGLVRTDFPPFDPPPPPRQDWNNFLWVEGFPVNSVAILYANGVITPKEMKMLYCPDEIRANLTYDVYRDQINEYPHPTGTIKTGYSGRPDGESVWSLINEVPVSSVIHFKPLYDFDGKALMAEDPGRPPFNHRVGSKSAVNAMYADGSVETHPFNDPLPNEHWMDVPVPVKLPHTATNFEGLPIWQQLDRQ